MHQPNDMHDIILHDSIVYLLYKTAVDDNGQKIKGLTVNCERVFCSYYSTPQWMILNGQTVEGLTMCIDASNT